MLLTTSERVARMIVKFDSSETGEVLMFAETARVLLHIIGKETTARGVFTPAEMQPAAARLQAAVAEARRQAAAQPEPEDEEEDKRKPPVVGLSQRAWPLIDMLERTDAGTGFMHEGFHPDDPSQFTRPWFAWANSLFAETIDKAVREGSRLVREFLGDLLGEHAVWVAAAASVA